MLQGRLVVFRSENLPVKHVLPRQEGYRANLSHLAAILIVFLIQLFPLIFNTPLQAQTTAVPAGVSQAPLKIKIDLSSSAIQFLQTSQPGLLDQHQQVQMSVTYLGHAWSVSIQASPLTKQPGNELIDASRLFVSSPATRTAPDVGGGPGFVPLSAPVEVARSGGFITLATPLDFRLLTFWDDTPGTYKGDIQFTAIIIP